MNGKVVLLRHLLVIWLAGVTGVIIGVTELHAEAYYGLYVEGAGNVANAATHGGTNPLWGYGLSTSSVAMYYTFAGARIWHQSTGGNILQDESLKQWFYGNGGITDTISSVGYGDRVSTRSAFQYSPSTHSTTAYTSHPDKSASCSGYWYNGNNCPP